MLSKLSVLIRCTQSTDEKKVVAVDKVKELGIKIMLHIRQSFIDNKGESWAVITNTVHQLCAHSWELFQLNSGKSIGKWSESPLEAWNKHVRSFKSGPSCRSRQTSVKENLHDVFKRMLILSHPEISIKRHRCTCQICGESGHTSRSSIHKNDEVDTGQEDEMLLKSLYV